MASTTKLVEKFIKLSEDIEKEVIDEGRNHGFYNGVKYTTKDFNDMRGALRQVQKVYRTGVKKSSKYLKKNQEYNRLQRVLSYYNVKKNKNENDYARIEEINKQLEEYKYKRDMERLENLEREIEKDKENLEMKDKIQEIKEKYGFYE